MRNNLFLAYNAMQETSSNKKVFAFALLGILLFGLLVYGLEKLASQDERQQVTVVQSTENDTKVKGNPNAPVTLLEYSDFQCPACAAYEPLVRNLNQDFPDTLKVVYRYFPLSTIHKNALVSAEAAEAAHRQGKFWEMHDQLFEHQDDWAQSENPTEIFRNYARNIGLDMGKFDADMTSDSVANAVEADRKIGTDADISGTPTFFLNGKQLASPKSYEEFKKVVEEELAKSSSQQ